METEEQENQAVSTDRRRIHQIFAPVRSRWAAFDDKYRSLINLFVALGFIAVLALVISMLKGYVQFI